MKDLDLNLAIWKIFMSPTLSAGNSSRKWPWREFEKCTRFFLEYYRTTFLGYRKVDQWSYRDYWYKPDWLQRFEVDIDEFCCTVGLVNTPLPRSTSCPTRCCVWEEWETIPNQSWKNKIEWCSENNFFSELNRIDGRPMAFEWKIFPAGILEEIQETIGELQCGPADFKDRIIFMSMFNDIEWDARRNEELCENNSKSVGEYARQFSRGHWSCLVPGSEWKRYGTYDGIQSGYWTQTA